MILLTGATGYIASHTWLALEAAGYRVAGLDDFSNSSSEVLKRLAALGADVSRFTRADVRDRAALDGVFAGGEIEAVVHFAAKKAVGESVAQPLLYYGVNVGGLVALAEAMRDHGCKTFVFSSSATVYGDPQQLPILESAPLSTTNPYGASKLMSESILRDVERSDAAWRIALLRYFNPVGAHESGTIGEDPRGTPNNLMPYVAQVAVGKRARACRSSAPTIRPPTAPACATTCTSSISPKATSRRCGACSAEATRSPSTSAPAAAAACSSWCRRSSAPAAGRCPTTSWRAARATSPPVMPTWRSPNSSWVGPRSANSTRCARTPGAGRRRIRTASLAERLEQRLLAREAPRRRAVLLAGEHPELAERHGALLRRFADQPGVL